MDKWRCVPCDYIYDPEEGDPEGNIPPALCANISETTSPPH